MNGKGGKHRDGWSKAISGSRWQAVLARVPGVLWVLLGQALQSATNFLTIAAMGRFAGVDELGVFALALSCYFFAVSVADTLVATPYTYLHTHADAEAHGELTISGMASAALVGAVAATLLTVVWWLDWTALAKLWPMLPCVVALTVLREFFKRHLLVTQRYAALFAMDAVLCALQLSGLLVVTLWEHLSAHSAMAVMGAATAFSLLPALSRQALSYSDAEHALRHLPRFLQSSVRYGRWLFLGGMCHVGSVQLYPWLAMASGGTRAAGLYAACVSIVNLLNPLLTGLTNYFRPRFMMALRDMPSKQAFSTYVMHRSIAFVAPALLLALGLSTMGDGMLSLLYGEHFRGGGAALAWMGWGTLAVAIAAPVQLALLAMHAPSTNFAYHGFSLSLLLGLAWLGWNSVDVTRLGQLYAAINTLAALLLIALWRGRLISQQ